MLNGAVAHWNTEADERKIGVVAYAKTVDSFAWYRSARALGLGARVERLAGLEEKDALAARRRVSARTPEQA